MTERYAGSDPADTLTGPVLRQIGYHLRLAREERGEDLKDIAQFLRIRRAYLQNLEDGDLTHIPGRAYALGFLRSYGDYLGFNGDAIVDEVKRTDEPLPESPALQMREPLPDSHRPPLLLVGASIAIAALVYVGWDYWQSRQNPAATAALEGVEDRPAGAAADAAEMTGAPAADRTATAPAARADETPSPTPQTAAADDGEAAAVAGLDDDDLPPLPAVPEPPMPERADSLTAGAEAGETAGGAESEAVVAAILARPAPGDEPAAAPDDAADAAADAATDDAGNNGDGVAAGEDAVAGGAARTSDLLQILAAETGVEDVRAFGAEDGEGRIVLMASEPSWVQIRSPSRDYVWTRTLEPGDAYFVPARDDLALWTGNAGGLKVVVDGKATAPLGASGEVRRDIPLAPEPLSERYATD